MSRFVLISLVGLGFVFYELSGGADFEPPKRPEAAAPVKTALNETAPSQSALAVQPVTVTRVGNAHTDKGQVKGQADTAQITSASAENAQAVSHAVSLVQKAVLNTSSAKTVPASGVAPAAGDTALTFNIDGIQLASLEAGLAGTTTDAALDAQLNPALQENVILPPAHIRADIRAVRASRVNMRQGPNTTYPILSRLQAGDKVEILRDEGAGWAKLRVEKTGQVGWIATSLLSPKGS